MLHLHLSNDLRRLVRLLATRLPSDPLERAFAQPVVVIPDLTTSTFLKDALADRDGVVAGLQLPFLKRFLRELLPRGAVELKAGRLRGLLRDLLLEPGALDEPALAPVRAYCAASRGDPRWADALAQRLASLFLKYERDLPERVARWRGGGGEGAGAWQGELFRRADARLGQLAEAGDARPRPLGRLLRGELDLSGVPDIVHVVLGESVDADQRGALVRLGRERDVHLYRLSVTEDSSASEVAQDLRRLWLRPELAEEEAWRAVADVVEVDRVAPPAPGGSLLSALQRDVASGSVPTEAGTLEPDASLSAWSYPTPRLEVERAALRLLERLAEDEADGSRRPLQLHEVALFVPRRRETYRPLIESVFRAHGLPVRFLFGRREGSLSELGEPLLDLIEGRRCERRQLLGVLAHPTVLARSELRREEVVRWIDRLGIAFGLDATQQAETYLADSPLDLFHAAAGARRLVLGAFCEGTVAGERRRVELPSGCEVAPFDVSPDERAGASRFVRLLASLAADARDARRPRPLSEWGPWLASLFRTHARPTDDREEVSLGRLVRALERLADDPGQRPVPFAVAAREAREQLAGLRRSSARHLSGGVLVADWLPPLPLRHVVGLGLDATWPGADERDGIDLRGDPGSDPLAPTRSRQAAAALLQTLCTAERVELSWVDRDERGDERHPSSLLDDLRRALSGRLLRAGAPWPAEDGAVEAPDRALALRDDLLHHLGSNVPAPDLQVVRAEVDPGVRAALDAVLGWVEPPPPAPIPVGGDAIEVTLAELRGFLKSPVQQTARRVAHLRERRIDGRRDPLPATEPLRLDALDALHLRQAAFVEGWNDWRVRPPGERGGPILVGALRERLEEEARVGRAVPTGPFYVVERRRHERVVEAWYHNLVQAAVAGPTPPLIAPHLGRAAPERRDREHREDREPSEVLPALELEVPLPGREPVRVTLSGRLGLLLGARVADATESVILSPSSRFDLKRFLTEAFLTHTILSAAGVRADRALSAHLIGSARRKTPFGAETFAALSPERARAWLTDIVTDLLVGQWRLLPVEAVLDHRKDQRGGSLRDHVIRARDAQWSWASCAWGPLTRVDHLEPPAEAEGLALVERRLGLFFESRDAGRAS